MIARRLLPASPSSLLDRQDRAITSARPRSVSRPVGRPRRRGKRGVPATERLGLQPGQPLAQTGSAASDQTLVAHESPAAAGEDRGPAREACQVLLAPAGGRTSNPAAVRRHVAADLGAAGAGRLTRGTGNAVRLAKKWPTCGAVSEKCLENRASSRPHVTTG